MLTVVLKKVGDTDSDRMNPWVSRLWILVIIFVVAVVAFAFYDATVLGNSERYGALAPYVTFNEKWGTNRGHVWVKSIEIWKDVLTPVQKLFGYGADTLGILMNIYDTPIKQNGMYVIYDSVHNEYLHYLVTVGVFGVISYIGFLASAIYKMCKKAKNHPEVAAVMFSTIAYAVQAVVNINLPVVTPIIFQLLFMGLCKTSDDSTSQK